MKSGNGQGIAILGLILTLLSCVAGWLALPQLQGLFSPGSRPTATQPVFSPPPVQPGANPSITLSKSSGPPGTQLTVRGTGYAPGEEIVLRFHTIELTRVNADGQGAFPEVAVTIPASWQFEGQFSIIATGSSSLKSATRPFEVT